MDQCNLVELMVFKDLNEEFYPRLNHLNTKRKNQVLKTIGNLERSLLIKRFIDNTGNSYFCEYLN